MGRGGYRPGSGRPKGAKGSKKRSPKARDEISADIIQEAENEDMQPLDYMLKVMRDQKADRSRRDRMAIAAAPFVHSRAGEVSGKKVRKDEAAKDAAGGKFGPRPAPKIVQMRKG